LKAAVGQSQKCKRKKAEKYMKRAIYQRRDALIGQK
jgi:hypothetical protein